MVFFCKFAYEDTDIWQMYQGNPRENAGMSRKLILIYLCEDNLKIHT